MNITKHADYFNPISDVKAPIHIIGCGAIGSTVAELLIRMGVEKINLYDFDIVSQHNIANQMFRDKDIMQPKLKALEDILKEINPAVTLTLHEEGYTNQKLSGYVFLAVDNIDLRRQIVESNQFNRTIKAMFDFRMRLTDAQHYAADWSNLNDIKKLLATMQFSHAEAKEATPTNACGTSLNIITTVRLITSAGLSNFINFIKNNSLKTVVLVDAANFYIEAFPMED